MLDSIKEVVEKISISVVILNKNFDILFCNKEFCNLINYNEGELINKKIIDFLNLSEIKNNVEIENLQCSFKLKENKSKELILNQKIYNKNNDIYLIHTYKENTITYEEFDRILIHDIQSPLTSIIGFAEMLMDDCNLERQHFDFLNFIKSSGYKILKTIEFRKLIKQILNNSYKLKRLFVKYGGIKKFYAKLIF